LAAISGFIGNDTARLKTMKRKEEDDQTKPFGAEEEVMKSKRGQCEEKDAWPAPP